MVDIKNKYVTGAEYRAHLFDLHRSQLASRKEKKFEHFQSVYANDVVVRQQAEPGICPDTYFLHFNQILSTVDTFHIFR